MGTPLRPVGQYGVLVLKGMAYGITHIVPGIGGGLILVVLGIYEQFVDAVGNLLVRRDRWRVYVPFLISLGVGMVIAMVVLSRVITAVAEHYPVAMSFFFMGLLVGTIPGILRIHGDMRPGPGRLAAAAGGVAIVVAFRLVQVRFGAESLDGTPTMAYLGATSFLAGGASVTPGLDGTYVWMLAGAYQTIIGAIGSLSDPASYRSVGEFLRLVAILAPAGIGAVGGILAFTRLIDSAFKRAPGLAYYAVLGLVAGSVYGLWPSEPRQSSFLVIALAFLAGTGAAMALGGKEPEDPAPEATRESLPLIPEQERK